MFNAIHTTKYERDIAAASNNDYKNHKVSQK